MLPHTLTGVSSPGHFNTQEPGRVMGHITGSPVMWRPWALHSDRDAQHEKTTIGTHTQTPKNINGFHHPVRLYLPKSKTEVYLSHLGKKVLASFPVQATLHFYNDDSSSEEESENEEEMMEKEWQLSVKRRT
ncbi:protein ripply3 [Astyanax mexicanus]|uniref:protein ripply3 n=1 Tax=Astyanax mexicanus TaxID=7994 RepID=UPI0020CAD6F3|nr:protein ripply3 [Astyanax mexicanus]